MTDVPRRRLKSGEYRFFRNELELLKRESVLDAETVADVLARYAPPTPRTSDFSRLVLLATTTLGALALGFAAFLLLRRNWAYLSPTLKTTIATGALAFAYVGELVARRFGKPILGETFAFGAAILFGVDVWQLAQIYQLPLSFPEGFWLWGIGVFASAYFAQFNARQFLAFAILLVWFCSDLGRSRVPGFLSPASLDPIIPNCAYSLPFFALLGYRWAARRRAASIQTLYFLLFVVWAFVLPFQWNDGAPWFYETFFGALLLIFGTRFIETRSIAVAAQVLGTFGVLAFLIPQTYRQTYFGSGSIFRSESSGVFGDSFVGVAPYCVLALAAAFVVFAEHRRRKASNAGKFAKSDVLAFVVSPVGVACLTILTFLTNAVVSYATPDKSSASDWGLALAFYSNALSVAVAWGLIVSGANGRPARYWVGTSYFVLWSILRYADLFGDVGGVLGAAIFFAGIAVALFVAAFCFAKFSRSRRVDSDGSNDDSATVSPTENGDFVDITIAPVSVVADSSAAAPFVPNAKTLKIGTLAAVAFQFAVVAGFVATQAATFADARKIVVETTPVDPTDLFRGDYVVLNYPFSSVSGRVWNGETRESVERFDVSGLKPARESNGRVFANLRLDPTDGVYRPFSLTSDRPASLAADEISLRGNRRRDRSTPVFGIETFFVQEGAGREIENARRVAGSGTARKRVLVDLLVAPNGKARVENVRVVDAPDAKTPPANGAPLFAPAATVELKSLEAPAD